MNTIHRGLTAAFRNNVSRSVAIRSNSAALIGNRHEIRSRLISSTHPTHLHTNNNVSALQNNLISGRGLLLRNRYSVCSSLHNNFIILFSPTYQINCNPTNLTLRRGFSSGDKKSGFVVSKFDNTLTSLRELHKYVRTHLSLDIWALNIILVAFVFGPTVWAAMKEASHDDDHYAFSIPVDDPDEHSVRILMDSIGSDEQNKDDGSTPTRKSGNNEKTTIISPEEDAKRILNDLLGSENVKTTASRVASNVIQSPPFQNAVKALVRNVWNDLINDPETSTQLTSLVQSVLQNERIYSAVKELLLQLLNDEEVYNELTKLVVQLGEERDVLNATQKLLTVSAHATLNDPDVLDHSMEFATEVVGDDVVQRTGGEALRNTVGYAVQPTGGAVMAGFGTILLAGILHFYFSRGSDRGGSSGNSISDHTTTPTSLSQPSTLSLGASSSNSLMKICQKLTNMPGYIYDTFCKAGGPIATFCSSWWAVSCTLSSKLGYTINAMYNCVVSNISCWLSLCRQFVGDRSNTPRTHDT